MANPINRQHSQQEVADLFGVDISTVRRWISQGQLRAYRYGPRIIRIDAEDLRTFREQIAPATYEHVQGGL